MSNLEKMLRVFAQEGFATSASSERFDLLAESMRVFVAVKEFPRVEELIDQWDSYQAFLAAEFYGERRLQEEKLWDTYLVLICPGLIGMTPETAAKVDDIAGNMAYCRKMLLDASVLADEERIRQKLSPLFAVPGADAGEGFDPLEALRTKLRTQGVSESLLSLLDETELKNLVERAKAGEKSCG